MREFDTKQHKNSDNYIHWIRVSGKIYDVEMMRKEICDYEADKILLGMEGEDYVFE